MTQIPKYIIPILCSLVVAVVIVAGIIFWVATPDTTTLYPTPADSPW